MSCSRFCSDGRSRRGCGIYTLSAGSEQLSELPTHIIKKLPKYPAVPVTRLGRLAVSAAHCGKKYGELMLLDALNMALEATRRIPSAPVVVYAKGETAVQFYKRYGFERFPDASDRLLMSMMTIQRLFGR